MSSYPTRSATPPPQKAELHSEYEMVFQATGVLEEAGAPSLRQSGTIRVIQGPKLLTVKTLDDQTMVYAFLSLNDINVPLLPDQRARRLSPRVFTLCVPEREFTVSFDPSTPDELVDEFDKIVAWFCKYEGAPVGEPVGAPAGSMALAGRIDSMGARGVALVDKVAGGLQERVDRAMEPQMRAAREAETKQVNIGGKITSGVLGTTRKGVGAVAGAASKVTDKGSDVVAAVIGGNPIMKNLRKAPEGSKRFKFHSTLTSGMVAVGKVYVAADEKGRAIVSTAGENSAEVLRERYGDQVAGAAKDSTHIAVDSYRIMRFPAKFGASALIKGAVKAAKTNTA